MKKVFSIFLVLVLALAFSVNAFAADDTGKAVVTEGEETGEVTPKSFTLNKEYEVAGGSVAPNETISFTVEQTKGVEEVALSVGDAKMTETDEDHKAPFALTFGKYTKVGRYEYKITEVVPEPKTLGVTYDTAVIYVVVTITNGEEDGDLVATVAVHRVETNEDDPELNDDNKIDPKPDEPANGDSAFKNQYDLGKLTVTKNVEGNLVTYGKEFTIHVTFKNTSGLTTGNKVSYTEAGEEKEAFLIGEETTIDVKLSNGASAVFTNIPAGVTYTVEEDSSHIAQDGQDIYTTEEGYTVSYTNEKGTIAKEDDITATVKNEKWIDVDTGIFLDSLPYILIVAGVAAAVVVMSIRKRREMEG